MEIRESGKRGVFKMTKKKYIALKRIVALIIALLLLLVPMVAYTSEGGVWAGSDSGLHGMQTNPEIVPHNGNPAPFEISAPPEDPNEELIWGTEATINICNDGCNHPGICFLCDNPVWGCITCNDGHHGRQQHVYIRGTATGPVTWEIICHGVFPRDEIDISFDSTLGSYGALVIEVHDGLIICRNRIIKLEVMRGGFTVTVSIVLRGCCIGCDSFCRGCEGCFNCVVDQCPFDDCEGLCVDCCHCPKPTIEKRAYPNTVEAGGAITYTIIVNTEGMNGYKFGYLSVVDRLNDYLRFSANSINVEGVVVCAIDGPRFEYIVDNNEITIYNMELYNCIVNGYVDQVVITFTVTVAENAPPGGEIWNTAYLYLIHPNIPNIGRRLLDFDSNLTLVRKEGPWIEKTASPAYPAVVNPGGTVTYTITVNRGDMNRVSFSNLRVVDDLYELLRFNPDSIRVEGVVICVTDGPQFEYDVYNNEITIYNMELYHCDEEGYVNQVVITFTATVVETAQPGVIPNTAHLYLEHEKLYYDYARARVYDRQGQREEVSFQVTKVWRGDEDYLDERPEYVTIELRRPNQAAPVRPAVRLNATNNWTHTWTGLEEKSDGVLIGYYVVEIDVPEFYEAYYGPLMRDGQNNIVTIVINTRQDDDVNDERRREDRRRRGPLTGDFAGAAPLLASLLLAMSSVLGGTFLRKNYKRK